MVGFLLCSAPFTYDLDTARQWFLHTFAIAAWTFGLTSARSVSVLYGACYQFPVARWFGFMSPLLPSLVALPVISIRPPRDPLFFFCVGPPLVACWASGRD